MVEVLFDIGVCRVISSSCLSSIPQTLGTCTYASASGGQGIAKRAIVRANQHDIIYDLTVSVMSYLDWPQHA